MVAPDARRGARPRPARRAVRLERAGHGRTEQQQEAEVDERRLEVRLAIQAAQQQPGGDEERADGDGVHAQHVRRAPRSGRRPRARARSRARRRTRPARARARRASRSGRRTRAGRARAAAGARARRGRGPSAASRARRCPCRAAAPRAAVDSRRRTSARGRAPREGRRGPRDVPEAERRGQRDRGADRDRPEPREVRLARGGPRAGRRPASPRPRGRSAARAAPRPARRARPGRRTPPAPGEGPAVAQPPDGLEERPAHGCGGRIPSRRMGKITEMSCSSSPRVKASANSSLTAAAVKSGRRSVRARSWR